MNSRLDMLMRGKGEKGVFTGFGEVAVSANAISPDFNAITSPAKPSLVGICRNRAQPSGTHEELRAEHEPSARVKKEVACCVVVSRLSNQDCSHKPSSPPLLAEPLNTHSFLVVR